MERIYSITAMSYHQGQIVLTLTEVRIIPPEEIERARMEADLRKEDTVDTGEQLQKVDFEPPPTSDTGRVVKEVTDEYLKIMKRELPGLFETPRGGSARGGTLIPATLLPRPVEILITPEGYEELGNPPLLTKLRMTLGVGE